MHVQLFTVCTELMLSVHRADCERATQPYSSGVGGTIFQAQDQPSKGVFVIRTCFRDGLVAIFLLSLLKFVWVYILAEF